MRKLNHNSNSDNRIIFGVLCTTNLNYKYVMLFFSFFFDICYPRNSELLAFVLLHVSEVKIIRHLKPLSECVQVVLTIVCQVGSQPTKQFI